MVRLVLDDDSVVELPIPQSVLVAWRVQCHRMVIPSGKARLVARLAQAFVDSVYSVLDPDLRPPSAKQIKYAQDIARELNVALPGEALRFCGTADEFIHRFVDAFNASRNRGKPLDAP